MGGLITMQPKAILSSYAKSMWFHFFVLFPFDMLSRFGEVTDAFIPINRENNKPKGIAFVTFA